MLTGSNALSFALATNPDGCDLDAADRAMIDYVLKLTRTPGDMNVADVEALKSVGFDDAGALDMGQGASYYNYVNRLADGMGVEMEDYWVDEPGTEQSRVVTRAQFEARR